MLWAIWCYVLEDHWWSSFSHCVPWIVIFKHIKIDASLFFKTWNDVRQGCVLSPPLFNVFVNIFISHSHGLLYCLLCQTTYTFDMCPPGYLAKRMLMFVPIIAVVFNVVFLYGNRDAIIAGFSDEPVSRRWTGSVKYHGVTVTDCKCLTFNSDLVNSRYSQCVIVSLPKRGILTKLAVSPRDTSSIYSNILHCCH